MNRQGSLRRSEASAVNLDIRHIKMNTRVSRFITLATVIICAYGCTISDESSESEILVARYIYEDQKCNSGCAEFVEPSYIEICVEKDSIYGVISLKNLNDSIRIRESEDSIFGISYSFNISNNQDSIIDYNIVLRYLIRPIIDTTLSFQNLNFGAFFFERKNDGFLHSTNYALINKVEVINHEIIFIIKHRDHLVSFENLMTSSILLRIRVGNIENLTEKVIYLKKE